MICSGFIFFNELDLLELRLESMYEFIDKFILVESAKTFTNEDKPYYYECNKERYKKYWDKIDYIKVDSFPSTCKNEWDREIFQRNMINKGVKDNNDNDILIVSDLDEIISPFGINCIKSFLKKYPESIVGVDLLNCWYYLNYIDKRFFFLEAPKAYTVKKSRSIMPQEARSFKACHIVRCGGWHFSYLGDVSAIVKKIQSFSHQEFNSDNWLNEKRIKKCIEEGVDLFNRDISDFVSIPLCNLLPHPVISQPKKYSKFLCSYKPIRFRTLLRLRLKFFVETSFLRYIYAIIKKYK